MSGPGPGLLVRPPVLKALGAPDPYMIGAPGLLQPADVTAARRFAPSPGAPPLSLLQPADATAVRPPVAGPTFDEIIGAGQDLLRGLAPPVKPALDAAAGVVNAAAMHAPVMDPLANAVTAGGMLAATTWAPESREAEMLVQDLARAAGGELEGNLPRFGILTAEKSGLDPALNLSRNQALEAILRERGLEPIPVRGSWKNPVTGRLEHESSYLIPGLDERSARNLGARFGQDAVITDQGYHEIASGKTFPHTGLTPASRGAAATTLPTGDRIAMGFDFDHPIQSATPEPAPLTKPAPARVGRTVYHGTYAPGFSVPSRSTDIGPHVGTPGQAAEIVRGSPFDPPSKWDVGYPTGSRIMKLTDYTQNPLRVLDENWGDPEAFTRELEKAGSITSKEAQTLLNAGGTQQEQFGRIRTLLESKGYDSLIYENRVEADMWAGSHRKLADSRVIFNPLRDLRNPLTGETPPFVPQGTPPVLGASEPRFAYHDPETGAISGMAVAPEDEQALAVAGRPLLRGGIHAGIYDTPETLENAKGQFLHALRQQYPMYAPYLQGPTGDRVFAAAMRAKLPNMPWPQEIAEIANSPAGAATRPWYHTWRPRMDEAFGNPQDADMFTRFHALLSAQKSPYENAGMSLRAFRDYKAGDLSFPTVGATQQRVQALRRIAEGGPIATSGPKVNNFYLALRGHPEAVVLDRHMGRVYFGRENISATEYPALEARVRADALRAGVSPRDYQAMIWGGRTQYPFVPPEHHVFQHLAEGETPELLEQYPGLQERITHSALRVNGQTYAAPLPATHVHVLENQVKPALVDPTYAPGQPGRWKKYYDALADANPDEDEGFLTNMGRYVTREQADAIAERSEQKIAGRTERLRRAPNQLHAMDVQTTPERITGSAIVHQGKTYTGATHADAMEQAGLLDEWYDPENYPDLDIKEGFITNRGRFLNREEASAFVGSTHERLQSENLPPRRRRRSK